MAGTEFNIPIWPGSSSFTTGSTPFGLYDSDTQFQDHADRFASYTAKKLGYPITDIELQDINFYAAFEESISEYSALVNQFNIKDNILYIRGAQTSTDLTQEPVSNNLDYVISLAQDYGNEAGAGGNVTWRTGSISVKEGVQRYDLDALIRDQVHPGEEIEIKKVFHQAPPALVRYFDPFLDTGLGSQNLLGQMGMGGKSPAVTFLMMPMYADLLRLQTIELNDEIRRSAYSFEVINNQLKIFPLPTGDFNLHVEYIVRSDRANPLKNNGSGSLVSDTSNAPYDFISYKNITSTGRKWIWNYGLACIMETLGWVRSKYSEIPIPDANITLNGPELISNAQADKELLIENLRTDLEDLSRKNQMEKSSEESEFLQDQLSRTPLKIYIG